MTRRLEIPGYDMLVINSTWGRETEPIEHPGSRKKYPATQIFQLARYNTPSESEVLKLIQTAAKEPDLFLNKECEGAEDRDYVLRVLKRFHPMEIKKIAQEEKDITEHLKSHYSRGPHQPRRTYIRCLNATIPNKTLDEVEEKIKEEKAAVYERLIRDIKINRWYFMIRLDGKGNFPSKGELEPLLEKEVRDCCIFKTDINYKNYQDMAEQVKTLAEVFNSRENIEKIEDFSERVLAISARDTLDNTFDCLIRKGLVDGIVRGLMGHGLGGIIGGFIDLPPLGDYGDDKEKSDFFSDFEED